jgi:hypothetical protein
VGGRSFGARLERAVLGGLMTIVAIAAEWLVSRRLR